MSTVPPPWRRNVLRRTVPESTDTDSRRRTARQQRWQTQLTKDRAALKRWLTRLKRATNTVTQLHQRICRLEKQLRDH